ncbi:glycosyltransferase [Gemelliphila asaccharolytica]|uniref:Glycosyltransferase, group 2 family protein n=1 Tax=Gemelliphila asaccharolytica TaxID=502393 RepID=A0ABR5TM29_9BACL|nr:glycosyltransferase [Gemella asaccharolytica]KXB58199.1 glycosyltransferase, group 2 family protein [Gemella asaccharolytica]
MYLTIAIAVYNGENYIKRCLDSIIKAKKKYQGDKEIEILAINDGSKDNSLEILKEYENKIKNYKIINKTNGGVSSVRNYAIDKANGRYLWIIDVDDEILDDSLNNILELEKKDVTMFNYMIKEPKHYYKNITPIEYLKNIALIEKKELLLQAGAMWKFVFEVKFLKQNLLKLINISVGEDLNFTIKSLLNATSMSFYNIPIYKYYINDNSIMTSKNIERKRDIFLSLTDIEKYFKEKGAFETYKEELEYLFIHHMLYVAYVDIVLIDKKSTVLDELLSYVNKNFPSWNKNKYLKKQNIIKRIILKIIKKDDRNLVRILIRLKKHLRKIR